MLVTGIAGPGLGARSGGRRVADENQGDYDLLARDQCGQLARSRIGQVIVDGSERDRFVFLARATRPRTPGCWCSTRAGKRWWPVTVFPTSQLTGPTNDIVLLEGFAYFANIRFAADGASPNRNALGGRHPSI